MEQSDFLLRKWRKRILGTLWATYFLMYFGRLNISIAFPFIAEHFSWTTVELGLISSTFFWIYAFGQLINGMLGDRLPPRRFVFAGLMGTAVMNLLFGLSSSLWTMILFWGINGIFQSMGWGPILKTASNWTTLEERNRVSGFLCTSLVAGSLGTWFVLGWTLNVLERWEFAFLIPAGILTLQAILWLILIRENPRQAGLNWKEEGPKDAEPVLSQYLRDTIEFLRSPSFLFLGVTTVILGMIKNGIVLWTPMLFVQNFNQPIGTATTYSLIVPLFGFLGIALATWIHHHLQGKDELVLIVLFVLGIGLALGVKFTSNLGSILPFSILLGLCASIVNGIDVILLSSIPLRFAHASKTSTLAGFLDFSSYVGSGLIALVSSFLINIKGWEIMFTVWILLFIVGALSNIPSLISLHKLEQRGIGG
ncbi:MAG: MFS transporter [Firmicutes bacterium]|nr:MFS transporter [Bacillota bacterium]